MSDERQKRVVLALDGLLPLFAMDLRQSDFPSDEERERTVATLVMADSLVAGGAPKGALNAVAKAIHWLSGQPGGIKVFDYHYVRGERWGAIRHELGTCEDCKHWRSQK